MDHVEPHAPGNHQKFAYSIYRGQQKIVVSASRGDNSLLQNLFILRFYFSLLVKTIIDFRMGKWEIQFVSKVVCNYPLICVINFVPKSVSFSDSTNLFLCSNPSCVNTSCLILYGQFSKQTWSQ